MRSPLTIVPFRLSRSTIESSSPVQRIRACSREACALASGMSHQGARPMTVRGPRIRNRSLWYRTEKVVTVTFQSIRSRAGFVTRFSLRDHRERLGLCDEKDALPGRQLKLVQGALGELRHECNVRREAHPYQDATFRIDDFFDRHRDHVAR